MTAAPKARGEAWFSALSEYDLRYTVGYLIWRARAEDRQLSSGTSRFARLLVKLLADPAFALTQAATIGAEATVADFVTGHEAASALLPSEARVLSQAFATAAIVSSTSGKAILTPEALNALLTYRTDTPVYGELLEFATDEKLIAELVPNASDRSWLVLAFLHSAATSRRRLGGRQNIERAREMLSSARNVSVETPATEGPENLRAQRVMSSILYDLAYIDYLTERPSAAREGFHASAEAAGKAQNSSGYYMSRILEYLVGFYDGEVGADEVRPLLEEALGYFTKAAGESPHAERWVMNVHAHLFDLACLTGDTSRAATEFAMLQKDPWVAKFHRLEKVKLWQARFHLARHAWRQAVTLYKSILDDELSRPAEDLVREGNARDLLDYGAALAALGSADLARQVWQRGLQSSEYACGWPWKTQIARRLAQLDSWSKTPS